MKSDSARIPPGKLPDTIPSSIFQDRSIAVLEAIVSFLQSVHHLTFHQIASLLNRDDRTIWTTSSRVKDKERSPVYAYPDSIEIPTSILKNRALSIFESVVVFMKEKKQLSYHEIAVLTNRNDRTIWTVYNRAIKQGSAR